MVELYGIVHGCSNRSLDVDVVGGRAAFVTEQVSLRPSTGFLREISEFPKGSMVGVEWLPENRWAELSDYLRTLAEREGIPGMVNVKTDLPYWGRVMDACREAGHELVFLDDAEIYKRYYEATIRFAKEHAKFDDLCMEEGESDLDYTLKLLRMHEAEHRADIVRRRIHEIERDNALLQAIKSADVSHAIVGLGHSEFWFANREAIRKAHGIVFDRYSTDMPIFHGLGPILTTDAVPEPHIVYMRTALEREVKFLETGRITDGTPDFVGAWDLVNPWHGYFELYIDSRQDGVVKGRIEDCIGSAVFEGTMTDSGFDFVKRYTVCSEGSSEEIKYKGKITPDGCYGYFYVGECGGAFCMMKGPQAEPIKLPLFFDDKKRDEGARQMKFEF